MNNFTIWCLLFFIGILNPYGEPLKSRLIKDNPKPMRFDFVKVYTGAMTSERYGAADAEIRNLKIRSCY